MKQVTTTTPREMGEVRHEGMQGSTHGQSNKTTSGHAVCVKLYLYFPDVFAPDSFSSNKHSKTYITASIVRFPAGASFRAVSQDAVSYRISISGFHPLGQGKVLRAVSAAPVAQDFSPPGKQC